MHLNKVMTLQVKQYSTSDPEGESDIEPGHSVSRVHRRFFGRPLGDRFLLERESGNEKEGA